MFFNNLFMRLIPTISIMLFLYPIYKYKSIRALIVLLNGILFHGFFPNNLNVLSFDVFCNCIITLYTFYYHPKILKLGIPIVGLSTLNILLWRYKYQKSRFFCDILHILVCHIPSVLILISHLKHKSLS